MFFFFYLGLDALYFLLPVLCIVSFNWKRKNRGRGLPYRFSQKKIGETRAVQSHDDAKLMRCCPGEGLAGEGHHVTLLHKYLEDQRPDGARGHRR